MNFSAPRNSDQSGGMKAEQKVNKDKHETFGDLPTHLPNTKSQPLEVKQFAPVPLLGTNIVLSTPEDIEKWIAERRRNYPTKQRRNDAAKPRVSKTKPTNHVSVMPTGSVGGGKVKEVAGVETFVPSKYYLNGKFVQSLIDRELLTVNKDIVRFIDDIVGNHYI